MISKLDDFDALLKEIITIIKKIVDYVLRVANEDEQVFQSEELQRNQTILCQLKMRIQEEIGSTLFKTTN